MSRSGLKIPAIFPTWILERNLSPEIATSHFVAGHFGIGLKKRFAGFWLWL